MESLSHVEKLKTSTLRDVVATRPTSPGRATLRELLLAKKTQLSSVSSPLKISEPVIVSLSSPVTSPIKRMRGRPPKTLACSKAPAVGVEKMCGCNASPEKRKELVVVPVQMNAEKVTPPPTKRVTTRTVPRFSSPPSRFSSPVKITTFSSPQPQKNSLVSPSKRPLKLGKNLATLRYLSSLNKD